MGDILVVERKKLSLNFLLEYFDLKNELVQILYESLSMKKSSYEHAIPKIEFDTYHLKFEVAIPMLKKFTDQLEKVQEDTVQ